MLYASSSYPSSRLRVLGNFFNTNGNGYQEIDDLVERLSQPPGDALPTRPPDYFFDGTVLFTGYARTLSVDGRVLPEPQSMIVGGVPASLKGQFPEVSFWDSFQPSLAPQPLRPYPNFKKAYSTFYTIGAQGRALLDASWMAAGIEFYEACQVYFAAGAPDYSDAYPGMRPDFTRAAYENAMNNKRRPGMDDQHFHQVISTAYGQAFTGDVDAFLKERWVTEQARITAFIGEILGDLHKELDRRLTSPPPSRRRSGPAA